MTAPQPQQKHPDDLFLITREELYRCYNQMSISGYKVSANYVEAMVLSRPHTSTSLPRLNTQPKGTTCEDCQRFRKEECPYPESNITITRCNSFLMDIEQHDSTTRKAEREKVLSPIKAVYDRFSHLDKILSARDPDCPMRQCYSDIWFVVKESLRREP